MHYISFLIRLFGIPNHFDIKEKKISSRNMIDTATINLNFLKNTSGNIVLTYASPMIDEMIFLFTNKIIEIRHNKLIIKKPRNTFNKQGHFIDPPKQKTFKFKKTMIENSYLKSVNFFISNIFQNKKFKLKLFEESINTSMLLLLNKNN